MAPKAKARRPLDSAWQYCVWVNPNDDHRVICNFCTAQMSGGINKLKYYLARIVCKDVVVCDKCLDEVTAEMVAALDAIREQTEKRERYKYETSMIGRSLMGPLDATPSTGGSTSAIAAKRSVTLLSSFLVQLRDLNHPWRDSMKRRGKKQIWM